MTEAALSLYTPVAGTCWGQRSSNSPPQLLLHEWGDEFWVHDHRRWGGFEKAMSQLRAPEPLNRACRDKYHALDQLASFAVCLEMTKLDAAEAFSGKSGLQK